MDPTRAHACIGKSQKRVSTVKPKRRSTAIEEDAEGEGKEVDKDEGTAADRTPMVTALLGARMLDLRAAYSRQSCRRDRLAWLREFAVVGGTEGRSSGDRFIVDRQPQLRRRRAFPAERRPPGVMAIRTVIRSQLTDTTCLFAFYAASRV